jgi:drug/metabolite transporter (DMT)-like permease
MTKERTLETPMRILLGLLGAIAFGLGVVIGVRELRLMRGGSPAVPAFLVAGVCLLVAFGGVVLMRGAVRGRITVRRPGHRSPIV